MKELEVGIVTKLSFLSAMIFYLRSILECYIRGTYNKFSEATNLYKH